MLRASAVGQRPATPACPSPGCGRSGSFRWGKERYYLEQAPDRFDAAESAGGEDYYLDPAEARGEWHGRAAARLGLTGAVGAEALRRVASEEVVAGARAAHEAAVREAFGCFEGTAAALRAVTTG